MTDDLVKRLRAGTGDGLRAHDWMNEAADRIEKLETANLKQSLIKVDDMARIEKLEAALRSIADIEHEDLPKPVSAAEGTLWAILDGCVVVAKRALEGKNE